MLTDLLWLKKTGDAGMQAAATAAPSRLNIQIGPAYLTV